MTYDWVPEFLDAEAKIHLDRSFKLLGLEGTIEMIERLSKGKVKDIYTDLLRQRGLIK
jgi:hypothetical protein